MVDYPPINERIQAGFLNFTQGATGLFTIALRLDGGECYRQLEQCGYDGLRAVIGQTGDGIFVYPQHRSLSTESASWNPPEGYRDGIQDYEYAHILKSLGQLNVVNTNLLPIAGSWSTGATTRTHWRAQESSWGNCSINLRPEHRQLASRMWKPIAAGCTLDERRVLLWRSQREGAVTQTQWLDFCLARRDSAPAREGFRCVEPATPAT